MARQKRPHTSAPRARDTRADNAAAVPTVLQQMLVSARPIPSPEELHAYDEVVPGAAERLLTIFEQQVQHRHEMERQSLQAEIHLALWGQRFAFFVACGGLVLSGAFGLTGREGSAIATFITSIVALAGLFIYGNRPAKDE
jgi:uncharacterized membrane protein